MSTISGFAKSGAWNARGFLAPVAVAIPLAIEAILLVKNIYQKPGYLKEKIIEVKGAVVRSFTRQGDESITQAIKRISKNIFITLSCLALMAGAAYLSMYLLPASVGILSAISAIIIIGKLFINAKTYKKQIVAAFTATPGEDPIEAKKRIRRSILKAVGIVVLLGISVGFGIVAGVYVLTPLLHGFSWSVYMPFQIKIVVFLEYAFLGVIHTCIMCYKFMKGDKAGALFHMMAAILSIIFPALYWNTDMRLHHSFWGLALMALPCRAAKILGSMVTFDSSLYLFAPLRGGYDAELGRFVEYDFINTIVDNFSLFFNGFMTAAIVGNINDNWSESVKAEKVAYSYPPL